jgi:hypothetical protein
MMIAVSAIMYTTSYLSRDCKFWVEVLGKVLPIEYCMSLWPGVLLLIHTSLSTPCYDFSESVAGQAPSREGSNQGVLREARRRSSSLTALVNARND